MASKKQKAKKIIKKRWEEVRAPQDICGNTVIGEIYLSGLQNAIGKKIQYNIGLVMNQPKYYKYDGTFKISKIEEKTILTELEGIQILASQKQNIILSKTNLIEDNQVYKTKEGILVKLSYSAATIKKITKTKETLIRSALRDFLTKKISELTYTDAVKSILNKDLPYEMKKVSHKLYPLRIMEITKFSIKTQTQRK